MDKKCRCGRVWRLQDHKLIVRDEGAIICKCGEDIARWNSSRAWSAELVQGLPEDQGQPIPCRCE